MARCLQWLVAFTFGLSHGFGFAGAPAEVGLPQHAIPVALLFFNIGVEAGQLIFVAAIPWLIWLLPYAALLFLEVALVKRAFDRLDGAIAYGIGGVSAYWLSERTAAFFCLTIGYGETAQWRFSTFYATADSST